MSAMTGDAATTGRSGATGAADAIEAALSGGRDGRGGAPAGRGRGRFLQRVFRTRAEDVLPLTVHHRRIYILPTGRGLAFLAALLLMLVASINYALSLGYALSFLLTGLFAATLLHTYRNLSGLEIVAVRAGTAFAGDPLPVRVDVADRAGHARSGIRIAARDGIADVASVAADATAGAELVLPTHRRGRRAVGRLTLSSDWPLGLWRTWSYVHAPVDALVWPAPEVDPPALPVGGRGEGDGARTTTSDGDVAGLRAYEVGDSPSRVAWKSAARGTGLRVRLFDALSDSRDVVLSLEATDARSMEARVSRLTAWVLEAERRGVDYALDLPELRLAPERGAARRRTALDALAKLGLADDVVGDAA